MLLDAVSKCERTYSVAGFEVSRLLEDRLLELRYSVRLAWLEQHDRSSMDGRFLSVHVEAVTILNIDVSTRRLAVESSDDPPPTIAVPRAADR